MVDFSMQLARDGAWKFAVSIAGKPVADLDSLIAARDIKVAEKSKIVTYDRFWASLVFGIIRIGERGSVKEKIEKLKA